MRRLRTFTPFPYTTLFRSSRGTLARRAPRHCRRVDAARVECATLPRMPRRPPARLTRALVVGDRKSTRLNSSHLGSSYAVFCLKKKNSEEVPRYDEDTQGN